MPFSDEYSSLKGQLGETKAKIAASPTAYAGNHPTSYKDSSLDAKSRSLKDSMQMAKDEYLKERWFGDQNQPKAQEGGQTGLMGRALHTLSMPLHGIVGAAEGITGKNVTSGFWENIDENVRTGKRTFSDLLKRSGVSGPVAGVAGFALDVAFDPVNWATVGTSALIPRIGVGLAKAGPRGMIEGAKSGALQKVSSTAKFLGAKNTATFQKIAQSSFDSTQRYNEMIGQTVDKIATESWSRDIFRGMKEKALESSPALAKLHKYWEYNPKNWHDQARQQDLVIDMVGGRPNFDKLREAVRKGEDPKELYESMAKERMEKAMGEGNPVEKIEDSMNYLVEESEATIAAIGGEARARKIGLVTKDAADAADILTEADPKIFTSLDGAENNIRLLEEGSTPSLMYDDIKELINSGLVDETGVKWYDDGRKKFMDWKSKTIKVKEKEIGITGKAILDGYGFYISLFKRVKVPGSPSAYTNSILGNPVMAKMAGLNAFSREYIASVKRGWQATGSGRNSDIALRELLGGPNSKEKIEYFMKNPTETQGLLGTSPSEMGLKLNSDRAIRMGREVGLVKKDMTDEEIRKALSDEVQDILKEVELTDIEKAGQNQSRILGKTKAEAVEDKMLRYTMESPNDYARKMALNPNEARDIVDPVGMIPQDFFDSPLANKFFDKVAERAKEGSVSAKVLDLFLNKAPNQYERIDQAFRFGLIDYTTTHGLSEQEIKLVGRFIDIGGADLGPVRNVDGIARYTLSTEKSMELASAAYLNYAAMPAAIKVLKNLPLLGSPFASFMYGMTLKTMQTAAYNPAVFNKVSFALHDLGGTQSPLEKENLKSPYSSRLNDYAMYRLPFFQENPMYLNLANILPFYSLNMFQPTDRNYGDTIPDSLVYLLDKLPIADDPAGQVIFDYLILPTILSEATQATGTFGQKIYPEGAGVTEKGLLATRALAETVLPGALGVAGLAVPDKDIPFTNTSIIEAAPLYRFRNIAYAKGGKNVYGVSGKESASSRTLRSLSGMMGLPVQSMDLTFTEGEFKEKIKDN